MSSPMPWFNFPQLWSTKQQLQTALISEHQITTSSKRLLLNLALRNGYLALQPGRITCPPFAHDSPCIYSLPSSESIEGNTWPSDSAMSASFSSRSCPSLTISSGLLTAHCGEFVRQPRWPFAGQWDAEKLPAPPPRQPCAPPGNATWPFNSNRYKNSKRKGCKRKKLWNPLSHGFRSIRPQSCCAVLACSRSAWPTSSVQFIHSRTIA